MHTISHRIANYLEKVGLVQRDMENSYLNMPIDDEDSLLHLQGASVSYSIAMGPQQGQKVFTLQTLPASTEGEYGQLANTSGFSLHAGVFAPNSNLRAQVTASQRGKNSSKLVNQDDKQSDKPYH
ncbi:MAG: IS91 family transposase, partial [Glaciecola sp.]